jgi:hypothetical protein
LRGCAVGIYAGAYVCAFTIWSDVWMRSVVPCSGHGDHEEQREEHSFETLNDWEGKLECEISGDCRFAR